MIFGSVCSGIGAAELAWGSLGWRCAFAAEIAGFPRAVLEKRFGAGTANGPRLFGDFTTIKAGDHEPIDVLVGGTPCQSFSVAGLRGGLADERGDLALEFLRLAGRSRPRWVVWENVPGVLSSGGGRDFGAFVGGMVELGYGLAWRVLDAQFFGLAQRRKRVFVVGCLGDWRAPVEVLLEPESMRGDSPPCREAPEGAAGGAGSGVAGRGGTFVPDVSLCLNAGGMGRQDHETETLIAGTLAGGARQSGGYSTDDIPPVAHALRGEGFDASEDGTGRGVPLVPVAGTLFSITPSNSNRDYNARANPVSQALTGAGNRPSARGGDVVAYRTAPKFGAWATGDPCHPPAVTSPAGVRRLTPRECERLQGFPDDHTAVTYRGKPAADGPRYKALGNSMAVPCMRWIGRRIEAIDTLAKGCAP